MTILASMNTINPSFGKIRPGSTTLLTPFGTPSTGKEIKLSDAFKVLSTKFKEVNEVGRFAPISVYIENPLKSSVVKYAWLVIEPSANKNDFRTRVLSFVSESPIDASVERSVVQATGNKFAIESVLKNSSTVAAFKDFVKESEKFFLSNTNL